jgi:raffinose/stachyose/melibiose transport system permease protein
MKKIFKYTLAFFWSLINLIPLFVVTFGSFKNTAGIYLGPFVLPESWNFTNYETALLRANVLNGIGNSFLYAILSVVAIVLLASMAGYVLSRHNGKLVNGVYIYFVLGVLVPVQATFIPLVAMVAKLGGQNNILTMIVIYVTFNLPLSILLITGYMKSVSREIDEAARIDGCGFFRTFSSIIAPISVPALATAGILAFINVYNDLIFANLFISTAARQTVTQVINGFSAQYNSDMGATFAALVVAILPMIIVFMCFQEKVIDGLSTGAVKG